MVDPPPLVLPVTLDPAHATILRALRFESAGTLQHCLGSDFYEGVRVVYAITNPEHTAVVYVGDSEIGRSLRSRLNAHLDSRSKAGKIERESLVFVHVLVTEYLVLDTFEQETGTMPELNKVKTQRFVMHHGKRIEQRQNPPWGKSIVQQGEHRYVLRIVGRK